MSLIAIGALLLTLTFHISVADSMIETKQVTNCENCVFHLTFESSLVAGPAAT